MSTNKTQNCGLHSWVGEDIFQLQEINENFSALDGEIGALESLLAAETAARTSQMAGRANVAQVTALETALAGKANIAQVTALETALAGKANTAQVTTLETTVAAMPRVVIGSYMGNGDNSRTITFDGTIKALLLEGSYGLRPPLTSNQSQGGLIVPEFPLGSGAATIEGNTLTVHYGGPNDEWRSNTKDIRYLYIAFFERS